MGSHNILSKSPNESGILELKDLVLIYISNDIWTESEWHLIKEKVTLFQYIGMYT